VSSPGTSKARGVMDDVHDNLGVGPTFQATRRFAWVETRRVRADGAIASYETDEGRGKAGHSQCVTCGEPIRRGSSMTVW
jgi:hypothetical protein